MLRKCFKYDFRSIFKIWWIAGVTVLGLAVAAGFGYKNLELRSQDPGRHFLLENTALGAYWFAIVAIVILTNVLVLIRYYSNFFSDEGYLTFTLPVKRSTLLFSKVLSGFTFNVMTNAVIVASFIIISLILPSDDPAYKTAFTQYIGDFAEIFFPIPKEAIGWVLLYTSEFIIIGTLVPLTSTLLLYMLITLGATVAKKHKVVATIGLMVGANYASSALIIPLLLAFGIWIDAADHLFLENIGDLQSLVLIAFALFFVCAVCAAICAIYVNVICGCLERKLNLP